MKQHRHCLQSDAASYKQPTHRSAVTHDCLIYLYFIALHCLWYSLIKLIPILTYTLPYLILTNISHPEDHTSGKELPNTVVATRVATAAIIPVISMWSIAHALHQMPKLIDVMTKFHTVAGEIIGSKILSVHARRWLGRKKIHYRSRPITQDYYTTSLWNVHGFVRISWRVVALDVHAMTRKG